MITFKADKQRSLKGDNLENVPSINNLKGLSKVLAIT